MRNFLILPTLVVASLLFAGCTSGGGGTPQTSEGPDPTEPVVTHDSGSVAGIVTDEELLGLGGVDLALQGTEIQGRSAADGNFALNGVPPGDHVLIASKLGYGSKATRVAVRVGEVTETQVTLIAMVVDEPRMESIPFKGRFECSGAAANVYWFECPGSSTAFPESSSTFQFEKPEGVAFLVGELRWQQASFGTGQNLDFNLVEQGRDDSQWYANVFGPSPLKILVKVGEEFVNPASPAAVGQPDKGGNTIVDPEDAKLQFDIYSSPSYAAEDVATVGLTFQQPYEGYVTLFYGMEPPAEFSAFPDA